jgi:hypothetical protein
MATLAALVEAFRTQERPVGTLVDESVVTAQAVAATRFYCGYATLTAREGIDPEPPIDADTDITESEWAIIRPLFIAYVEREVAIHLEASRSFGVEPYGRSASEINTDITQIETDLPHKAFRRPIVTV